MADTAVSSDAKLKAFTDIWMHQNRLMWDRLQTMLITQAVFFGAGYTLRAMDFREIIFLPFALAIISTFALLHISHVDRAVRNRFEGRIKEQFKFHIRLRDDDRDDQLAYSEISWANLKWVGSGFYLNAMFFAAMTADLFTAWVLTITKSH